ncbi:MAG: hypothetical protein ACI9LM_002718 [Alteromonadaceae bacterium]|jgi:hypothetical protein
MLINQSIVFYMRIISKHQIFLKTILLVSQLAELNIAATIYLKVNIFVNCLNNKYERSGIKVEKVKLVRLSSLFEKMVSDNANNAEKRELNNLYQEYINFGRDNEIHHSSSKQHQAVG